jgi:hypothetical protein
MLPVDFASVNRGAYQWVMLMKAIRSAWLGCTIPAANANIAEPDGMPFCLAQHNSGYSVNGSFAEYAIGSAAYVARLPPNPDFVAMAPILCAGVTTYKGIKETEVRPGEWIAIRIQASLHRSAISSTASGPPRASAYAEKPAHELASLGAS